MVGAGKRDEESYEQMKQQVTDTLRQATASASGLEYTEQAFHVQAFWHIPVTVEFDVMLFGGPTFFQVKNDLISGISDRDVVEAGGDFSSVSLQNISTTRASESTVGFNVGIDGTYMFIRDGGTFIRNAGIGAMLRYSRGSADLAAPAGTGSESFSIDAGGLEIAAGLRFRRVSRAKEMNPITATAIPDH